MANGDDHRGSTNGRAAPWWLGFVMAAGIPIVGSYIAVSRLTEGNAAKVAELERRITQLETDRARLDNRAEDSRASIIEMAGRLDTMMRADNPRLNGLELGLAGITREFNRAQATNEARIDNVAEIMAEMQRLIAAAIRNTEPQPLRDR